MHNISQWAVNLVRGLMAATALVVMSQQAAHASTSTLDGIGVVTSRSGEVHIAGQKPKLHEQLTLSGATLQTGAKSSLFLVLSNGVAISLGPNTELKIEHYTQKPFSKKKESQQYEPSESQLKINLLKGSLCCAFEHLSPISEARIKTPNGELRIHNGNSILLTDTKQTQINMFSGTATFYSPSANGRIFISDSQSIVLDSNSASNGKPASTEAIETIDKVWHNMAEATDYARTRIVFREAASGEVATPVFVLPENFHENATARPYHFKQRVKP